MSTSLTVDNPFTGDVACSLPLADEAVVSATLDRAEAAARAFRASTVPERVAIC
jgi:acyl-CoA reductase-like NAD-dependent aldehyde dehydrogenase